MEKERRFHDGRRVGEYKLGERESRVESSRFPVEPGFALYSFGPLPRIDIGRARGETNCLSFGPSPLSRLLTGSLSQPSTSAQVVSR